MNYEIVCGIETHIELATKTKIFCGCTTEFGESPTPIAALFAPVSREPFRFLTKKWWNMPLKPAWR